MTIAPMIDERIAILETDNANFKRWQSTQDEAISKFDSKFDKLMFGIIAELCATILVFITVMVKGH